MLRKLQKILRGEKGQSLVEWALVALFVVGIVYMFRDSNILSQVTKSYNNVGSYLSSTPTSEQAINKYGALSNSELREAVSNQERIAMDDATLRNIAGAFLGKTKTEIKDMLLKNNGDPKISTYNPNGALNQGTLLFDYYIDSTGDGENESVKTRFANGFIAKDNLVNWMQGNYTQYPSTQKEMTSDNRYFFSDDLIDPKGIVSGTPPQVGNYAVSVRCAFDFDKTTGQATAVHIWATRNKEDSNYKPNTNHWVRSETEGLGQNGKMNITVE